MALYQLGKGLNLHKGQMVRIDGPHDTLGIVLTPQESGYYLIRGLGKSRKLTEEQKRLQKV